MELRNLADPANVLVLLVTLCVFVVPIFIIFPPVPVERSDALRQTHRKIGKPAALTTRRTAGAAIASQKTTAGRANPATAKAAGGTVRKLCIYPVKSCGGIDIPKSKVLPTGLEHDRLYGFAQLRSPFPQSLDMPQAERDAHRWEFATQRQFPLLATVSAELWVPDATKKSRLLGGGSFAAEAFIVLRFPWKEAGFKGAMEWLAAKISRGWSGVAEKEILLPVAFPSDEEIKERGYEYETVRVWKEDVRALNMAKELPKELRLYLGVSNQLGLFRINPKERRDVFRAAPRKEEARYQPIIDFHDAYPLHLLNLSSLGDMESKLKKDEDIQELDARRFRANIIIDGPPAYDEDSWKKVRFRPGSSAAASDCTFHVSCRTVRCKMPNVDQDTGFRHGVEPDSALRKYRDVDAGAPKKGCLGMQLCPLFEEAGRTSFLESWIYEGMELEVLERGDHFYIKQ